MWLPDSGKTFRIKPIKTSAEHTELKLKFKSEEAYFIVFRKPEDASAKQFVPWDQHESILLDLSSDWELTFPDGSYVNMKSLKSWSDLKHSSLKYHSGTASYRKKFFITREQLDKKGEFYIDLGQVDVVAEVCINNTRSKIAWKKPYRVCVNDTLIEGENELMIRVANLWVNRIIGDQKFPDDHSWTSDTGSTARGLGLEFIPNWVTTETERPIKARKTFYAWKWMHLKASKPLLSSGMLGPVKLIHRHSF